MARIRTIKPEFFRHEELYNAEKQTSLPLRIAFAGLFTVADREGRFKWKAKQLKFDVLPYDEIDFEKVLEALHKYDFIIKYVVDGKEYGCIPSFTVHQVINNREAKSTLPEPGKETTRAPRVKDASFTLDDAASGEGKGREGKGTYTQVAKVVCEIFGKDYVADPQDRMPATANWFKTIDHQAGLIMQQWPEDVAIRQIRAYIKHCKATKRKLIGTDFKVAETILSSDWVKLSDPDAQPRASPFKEAEYNRSLWTAEAWREQYKYQIANNPEFRKHFNIPAT